MRFYEGKDLNDELCNASVFKQLTTMRSKTTQCTRKKFIGDLCKQHAKVNTKLPITYSTVHSARYLLAEIHLLAALPGELDKKVNLELNRKPR